MKKDTLHKKAQELRNLIFEGIVHSPVLNSNAEKFREAADEWLKIMLKQGIFRVQLFATAHFLEATGRRLLERRVDEIELGKSYVESAMESGETLVLVDHGGSVANNYGFPAQTEGLVSVAFPNGYLCQFGARLPANKVTSSGILAACLGDWARPYQDPRFSTEKAAQVRDLIIATAAEQLQVVDPEFEVSFSMSAECVD